MDRRAALLGAVLLAGSYRPWRYAVEVEIPAWTSLAAVAFLSAALAPTQTVASALALGVAAAGAIAMHGLNALLATTAVPCWLLLRHGLRQTVAYASGATVALTDARGRGVPAATWSEIAVGRCATSSS